MTLLHGTPALALHGRTEPAADAGVALGAEVSAVALAANLPSATAVDEAAAGRSTPAARWCALRRGPTGAATPAT